MQLALTEADFHAGAIHYINAHGTGTLENDISETLAIRSLYHSGSPPPVSSSKSYFGHTLGGAGILEFIASLLGLQGGFIPATLNFKTARPGCDLDYVPNLPRTARIDAFLSISAAFGGVNAVAVGARVGSASRPARARQRVAITGLGVISPIGLGIEAFRLGLQAGVSGLMPIGRFETRSGTRCFGGLVGEFSTRKLAPTVDVRRMDNLTRYAVVAAAMALKDAGLTNRIKSERLGLHVALTRGPVAALESFQDTLASNGIAGLSAKYFPAIVLSTVAGLIAQAHQIKGANFTFVDGAGAGFSALAHGSDYLALHPELDALIVISADELCGLSYQMFDRLGLMADDPENLRLYAPDGAGFVPGEGAVALILERAEQATSRRHTPYGYVVGMALGGEGRSDALVDEQGAKLESLARQALDASGGTADIVYGLARGVARYDASEANALQRLLGGGKTPVVCLNGQLGLAEACSGLFAVSGALLSLRFGEAYRSLATEYAPSELGFVREGAATGNFQRALVLGGNEFGNSAAFVLAKTLESS